MFIFSVWAHLWSSGNLQRAPVILKSSTETARSLALNAVNLLTSIFHQMYESYHLPQISWEGNSFRLIISEADQSL